MENNKIKVVRSIVQKSQLEDGLRMDAEFYGKIGNDGKVIKILRY